MSGLEPEDFTEAEDLLGSFTYGIRKFYLAGSWEDKLLGVMLEETVDSFLIALPVRLIEMEDKQLVLEEVEEGPFVRFMKSDFRAITFAVGKQKSLYLGYLEIKSPSAFPELLDMIGEKYQSSSNPQPEEPMNDSIREMREDIDSISFGDEPNMEHEEVELPTPDEGTLIRGNLSDSQLRTTVEDAMKEGRFLPAQGKLPN